MQDVGGAGTIFPWHRYRWNAPLRLSTPYGMTTLRRVTVGSRASPLSVAQTEEVLSQLRVHFPESDFAVVAIDDLQAHLLAADRDIDRSGGQLDQLAGPAM